MSQECEAKCQENPDAIDKINWKCVVCKQDVKPAFDALMVQRELDRANAEKAALEAAAKRGELTEEEKAERRAM